MIEVSVVIPTFNRASPLKRALDSVLSQESVLFEVLVIDDGSTDNTKEMIRTSYPQVIYFEQANKGPSAARNLGIEKAKGDWIAFLDSDDEWNAGKLRAQLDFFKANPDYRICQTEEIWIRNGVRVNPMKKHKKYGGYIFKECLPLCIVSPSAVMIRSDLFEDIGLFDESLLACEDYDLWLRIAAREPIGLIPQPYLIKYGGHSDQQSHKFEVMDLLRIKSLAKLLSSKTLNEERTKQARAMFDEKVKIVREGARKRNNNEIVEKVEKLVQGVREWGLENSKNHPLSPNP